MIAQTNNFQVYDKTKAILLILVCTLLTASGQLFWKLGVSNLNNSIDLLSYLNIYIILGFITYGLGAVLLILALKYWELSRVHPFLALGYVWISILAPIFLGELLSLNKIIGIIIIIIGVICIGKE